MPLFESLTSKVISVFMVSAITSGYKRVKKYIKGTKKDVDKLKEEVHDLKIEIKRLKDEKKKDEE
jgi:cell division protein FtsB